VQTEGWLVWKSLQTTARVLGTIFFDLQVYGLENIPRRGGALIASNHQSNLDPVLLNTRLRRPLSYLAKSELFENPFSNWLLRSVGVIPVYYGTGNFGAVRQSIQVLRDGHLLSIYPEGSRTHDGKIAPMEKGIALIGRRAQVPVIPVVIIGAYEAWPWNRRIPRPRPVRIQIGPAMDLTDKTPDELLETVDRTLRRMFDDLTEQSRIRDGPITGWR
jgi:1-acyl-sn-glycerol-3-phosphate acyltransferase